MIIVCWNEINDELFLEYPAPSQFNNTREKSQKGWSNDGNNGLQRKDHSTKMQNITRLPRLPGYPGYSGPLLLISLYARWNRYQSFRVITVNIRVWLEPSRPTQTNEALSFIHNDCWDERGSRADITLGEGWWLRIRQRVRQAETGVSEVTVVTRLLGYQVTRLPGYQVTADHWE